MKTKKNRTEFSLKSRVVVDRTSAFDARIYLELPNGEKQFIAQLTTNEILHYNEGVLDFRELRRDVSQQQ